MQKGYGLITYHRACRYAAKLLSGSHGIVGQEGGITLVMHLVRSLEDQIVAYLFLLIVPVMRCMNDRAQNVRVSAASVFSQLVALLPLAQVHPLHL